jgi:hypothetical protein
METDQDAHGQHVAGPAARPPGDAMAAYVIVAPLFLAASPFEFLVRSEGLGGYRAGR